MIGKFGMPRFHPIGADYRQLDIRRLPGGPTRHIDFLEPLSDDEGRTAPFLARLPAGRYEITAWRLRSLAGPDAQEEPAVEFEVRGGSFTCVGALYPLRLWRSGVPYVTALLPRDECLVIEQQMRGRVDEDLPRLQVSLARNRLCPSCRAEVDQGGGPPLSGHHDPNNLPMLIVELRRLTGSDQPAVRWPAALQESTRGLELKVCVGPDGRVGEAKVLRSAHADLDAQVLSNVRTWTFRPLTVGGRPAPFCYQPRWELRRPSSSAVPPPPS